MHSRIYEFFRDQGSALGGALALLAGVIAYLGATCAADRQVAALRRRDRLQARGIAVAVYPELMTVKVAHDRATSVVADRLSSANDGLKISILQVIESARIEIPRMLARNVDNFFLLEPGGASLLRVVSFIAEYNERIGAVMREIDENPDRFDPATLKKDLEGRLTAIRRVTRDAQNELAPLRDEATAEAPAKMRLLRRLCFSGRKSGWWPI